MAKDIDDTQWQKDMWDSDEDIKEYTRKEIKEIRFSTAIVTTFIVSAFWIIVRIIF